MKNIALIYDMSHQNNADKIEEKLIEKGWNVLVADEVISLNGRDLSVQAFLKVNSRDPRNRYAVELKKEMRKLAINRIEKSNVVLVCNFPTDKITGFISASMFYELIIAEYLSKPTYMLEKLNNNQEYIFSEVNSMDLVFINNDFSRIDMSEEKEDQYTNILDIPIEKRNTKKRILAKKE